MWGYFWIKHCHRKWKIRGEALSSQGQCNWLGKLEKKKKPYFLFLQQTQRNKTTLQLLVRAMPTSLKKTRKSNLILRTLSPADKVLISSTTEALLQQSTIHTYLQTRFSTFAWDSPCSVERGIFCWSLTWQENHLGDHHTFLSDRASVKQLPWKTLNRTNTWYRFRFENI